MRDRCLGDVFLLFLLGFNFRVKGRERERERLKKGYSFYSMCRRDGAKGSVNAVGVLAIADDHGPMDRSCPKAQRSRTAYCSGCLCVYVPVRRCSTATYSACAVHWMCPFSFVILPELCVFSSAEDSFSETPPTKKKNKNPPLSSHIRDGLGFPPFYTYGHTSRSADRPTHEDDARARLIVRRIFLFLSCCGPFVSECGFFEC